ncbi:MAG: hypothetical protein GXO62_08485 [Epsilonproteobacteria bacterium]|nr:hypothetical protein [Campylobacterota bacterium]
MFYYLYGIHFALAVSWAIFLLLFIEKGDKFYGYLSLFFMVVLLADGTKMILLGAQKGNWLHLKLSLDIVLMLENVYLLFKKPSKRVKFFMFWFSYLSFMVMITLSMFKPF